MKCLSPSSCLPSNPFTAQGCIGRPATQVYSLITSVKWLYLARVIALYKLVIDYCLDIRAPMFLQIFGLSVFFESATHFFVHTYNAAVCPEFYTVGHRSAYERSEKLKAVSPLAAAIVDLVDKIIAPAGGAIIPMATKNRFLRIVTSPLNGFLAAWDEGFQPMFWRGCAVVVATQMLPIGPIFAFLGKIHSFSVFTRFFKGVYFIATSRYPVIDQGLRKLLSILLPMLRRGIFAPSVPPLVMLMNFEIVVNFTLQTSLSGMGFKFSESERRGMMRGFEKPNSSKMVGYGNDRFIDLSAVSFDQRVDYISCTERIRRLEGWANRIAWVWPSTASYRYLVA